jgi:DNA-binding NarL/FixJ family response regulator
MHEKVKILIIDDDKNFRKILSMRLRSGYADGVFHQTQDLREAKVALLKESPFDLLILDQHLPDGTGSDFLTDELIGDTPVLCMSSDNAPEIPATTLKQGARFFLSKNRVSESFFIPLTKSLIERAHFEKEMRSAIRSAEILESVRTLLRTLQHEINNPLGALFGATYVLQSSEGSDEDRKKALELVQKSSTRIKHVLDKLSETAELETVSKATETLYQIPGDPSWEKK